MIKCKILWFKELYIDYDSIQNALIDYSDWEELNEEDFALLQKYAACLPTQYPWIPKLVKADEVKIETRVKQVKGFLEEQKKEEAKRNEEKEKKRIARTLKNKAKDVESKKKLLEQLKKELGESA